VLRDAADERDHPGDVGRVGWGGDVAEDGLVDAFRRHLGPPEGFLGGGLAEVLGGDVVEYAECLGERRADAFENGYVKHRVPRLQSGEPVSVPSRKEFPCAGLSRSSPWVLVL